MNKRRTSSLLTISELAVEQTSVSNLGNLEHRHSMSFKVNCASPTMKCFKVSPCTAARSRINIRGIPVWPMLIVNTCNRKVSRPAIGTRSRIHAQSFCGPRLSIELVRTVKWRRTGWGGPLESSSSSLLLDETCNGRGG